MHTHSKEYCLHLYSRYYFISARVMFRPFRIIQGHWFWCQSQMRMRLPISPS